MNNIILIGLKGVGKTSIGQQLAKALQRSFVDTDHIILNGFSDYSRISAVYEQVGAAGFIELEKQAVAQAVLQDNSVIAVGGSTMLQADNVALLKQSGKIIYLRAKPETLLPFLRTHPPAFLRGDNFDELFEQYYQKRAGYYAEIADIIVDADEPKLILIKMLTTLD